MTIYRVDDRLTLKYFTLWRLKGNRPIILSESLIQMACVSLIQNQLKAIIGMDLHNISCAACGEPIDATDKVIQERIFE